MAVQSTGHQRQLQVAIDLHRHRRAQGVHAEKNDAIRDAVLDDHPPSVGLISLAAVGVSWLSSLSLAYVVNLESKISSSDRPPRSFLPEPGEAKDLVIRVVLVQLPVGIAEDTSRDILHQEGQDGLLPSALLGDGGASRSGHPRQGRGSCENRGRRNARGAARAGSRRRTSVASVPNSRPERSGSCTPSSRIVWG